MSLRSLNTVTQEKQFEDFERSIERRTQSSEFSENVKRNVLWLESFRNVNKGNGKKNQGKLRITIHKTQNTEKRFAVRIFSKCQREKWKKKSRKIPNYKAQKSEKKQKRMAAFCSESFLNLFGENVKKINFSLTGDLIDLSAFTVGKFFEIIFTLRPLIQNSMNFEKWNWEIRWFVKWQINSISK